VKNFKIEIYGDITPERQYRYVPRTSGVIEVNLSDGIDVNFTRPTVTTVRGDFSSLYCAFYAEKIRRYLQQ